MHYSLISKPCPGEQECLVIGVFDDEKNNAPSFGNEQIQALYPRLISKLGDKGDWVWQAEVDGYGLMLINCGKKDEFDGVQLTKRMNDIVSTLLKQRIVSATICLPQVINRDANWQLMQMVLLIDSGCYQLLDFKSTERKLPSLTQVQFCLPDANEEAIRSANAVASGIHLTKTMADLPANRCTPTYLAEQAMQLSKEYPSITTKIFDREQIRELGMGSFLAVAQGSEEPPRFIEIQYQGSSKQQPVVLVGKGVTFDSGGLSIKPAAAMDEMKYDMAGAASVLGTIKACAELNLPLNVIGLIPSTENMLSGQAVKPGDIVTSMSGQTIEILNTDAEGRLILADALTYAERFDPAFVIDIATLTGGVIVALGTFMTGFMTPDDDLANDIMTAALESNEPSWRLPLNEMYQEAIDSPLADMINAGFDRTASSITAACFLSRFTKNYRWAHLDIAGTAWVSGKKRHATGRPVSLLVQLLSHVAHSR